MPETRPCTAEGLSSTLSTIADHLAGYYPKTVLLFGSAAAFIGQPGDSPLPNDLDILLICDNPLIGLNFEALSPPVELHRFHTQEAVAVARSLRYDRKAVALAKLYAKNVAKQHARDVILASILLGPSYNDFGIEQISIGGKPDPRDYSLHQVLRGQGWWSRLTAWARERRGYLQALADKMVGADHFQ